MRARLIELPQALANACAYLGQALGAKNINVVDVTASRSDRPFVLVPNDLVPTYEL